MRGAVGDNEGPATLEEPEELQVSLVTAEEPLSADGAAPELAASSRLEGRGETTDRSGG